MKARNRLDPDLRNGVSATDTPDATSRALHFREVLTCAELRQESTRGRPPTTDEAQRMNTFSRWEMPKGGKMPPLNTATPHERALIIASMEMRSAWEKSEEGKTRLWSLDDFPSATPAQWYKRLELLPNLPNLPDIKDERQTCFFGAPRTTRDNPRVLASESRDVVDGDVILQPRWEDLHSAQRRSTLIIAALYGVTPNSAFRAYASQLDRAHLRAWRSGFD